MVAKRYRRFDGISTHINADNGKSLENCWRYIESNDDEERGRVLPLEQI